MFSIETVNIIRNFQLFWKDFNMKLDTIREEYKYAALNEANMPKDPLKKFDQWMNEALAAKVNYPTAMSVSTIGNNGFPQSRIVLLKDFHEKGFVFFTNYNSMKGNAINTNPAVSLLFFWPALERQVRITGFAEKTSDEISDHYFQSRPLLSQAAAILSDQSKKVSSREKLEEQFNKLTKNLPDKYFDRPENWGGFLVNPVKIEFWQGRENRLHDRILYEKVDGKWQISRLAP